jgi:hypothetical protein
MLPINSPLRMLTGRPPRPRRRPSLVRVSSNSSWLISAPEWPNQPPHSLASRRRDLSTKPWTGHQVEKVFFADGSVVEIDAQILDWGEVDRAKSVPTEAQFSGSSPSRDESECRRILPGLSRPLCVVTTSEWPNRDRLTHSQPRKSSQPLRRRNTSSWPRPFRSTARAKEGF